MKLLVHVCCRDCLEKFHYAFKKVYPRVSFTAFFYNPNIHPILEWQTRLKDVKNFCMEHKGVYFRGYDWDVKVWKAKIMAKADSKLYVPRSVRCPICYKIRLSKLVNVAKDKGFTHVYTTMLTSEYQNRKLIKSILRDLLSGTNIELLDDSNLKFEHINAKGFYKQNFCGCVYSLLEKMMQKV